MGSEGGFFRRKGLFGSVSKMLLHKCLIERIERAIRVTGEGGQRVDQGFFVPALPLEPPDMTIPLK